MAAWKEFRLVKEPDMKELHTPAKSDTQPTVFYAQNFRHYIHTNTHIEEYYSAIKGMKVYNLYQNGCS